MLGGRWAQVIGRSSLAVPGNIVRIVHAREPGNEISLISSPRAPEPKGTRVSR